MIINEKSQNTKSLRTRKCIQCTQFSYVAILMAREGICVSLHVHAFMHRTVYKPIGIKSETSLFL